MSGEYGWWLFVVGVALGAAVVWLLRGAFRRQDDDENAAERRAEAEWIAETIEEAGGIAPAELVEQVLDLHREYLAGPPLPEATEVPELDEPAPIDPEPPIADPEGLASRERSAVVQGDRGGSAGDAAPV